jgi:hypothetical protein
VKSLAVRRHRLGLLGVQLRLRDAGALGLAAGDREVICFAVDPAHPENSRISLRTVKE